MKVWAIANQKGGVGKTTTAISLAGLLASQSHRVLVIDIDPHGSLTGYLGFDPELEEHSVFSLFNNASQCSLPLNRTAIQNLDIATSSTLLATLERRMGMNSGMGLVLKNAVDSIRDQYDYVLIDCPPMLGVLMVNALAACDYLIVPVQSEYLALKGLERMIGTIAMINRSRNTHIDYIIVPTLYDRRTRVSAATLSHLHKDYARELWHSVIPVDTNFREASLQGLPISMVYPKSRGSIAYQNLLSFIDKGSRNPSADIRAVCA